MEEESEVRQKYDRLRCLYFTATGKFHLSTENNLVPIGHGLGSGEQLYIKVFTLLKVVVNTALRCHACCDQKRPSHC